ncbi:hypothetical protein G9C98_007845 [Cotesia typhae]|uniref:Uncharacterized protein n=1 Tax=Cotesia typhae TaxID=2053667 RepID=A0A8J5R1E6_9HYME|nr:hypothetical protein G9C98_007845 [Cotesia typhae]
MQVLLQAIELLLLAVVVGSNARRDEILNEDLFGGQRTRGNFNINSNSNINYNNQQQHNSPFLPNYQRERKPNIVLILTDDQDVELGSLNFMPNTLRRIRDEGAELRHAYVTTPMCCPSRSSLLTGRYVHNHQVFTNNDNCSSPQWQRDHEPHTFATYLSNAGYRTGYFGKYLNKYNGSYIPPGWREWGGLIMNSRYYNYSVNMNGKKIKHGFEYSKDYYPDLIANDSVAFLRQSKHNFARKPVMLVASFPAPHGPEDSAPQFSQLFFNVTTHHTPAYDYAPNLDKQWILQVTQKMQPIHKQFTDLLMTKRLQTLQSVDAAVERIYQELKDLGELDNTYIIYTSDHGYHLGQFGLIKGKSFPFEFDVRVPCLIRGPGIAPGSVRQNATLAKQLLDPTPDELAIDTDTEFEGDRLLDNDTGSDQDISDDDDLEDSITDESNGDVNLDNGVNPSLNLNSKHERLTYECSKPEAQTNCLPGQKWRCEKEGHRWRRHKCKYTTTASSITSGTAHKSSKKCACFTPNGVVYTRLESNDFPRENRGGLYDDGEGFLSGGRGKRSIVDWEKIKHDGKLKFKSTKSGYCGEDLEDDLRDRRAIDEEDDEKFIEELEILREELSHERNKRDVNENTINFMGDRLIGYSKYLVNNSVKENDYNDDDNKDETDYNVNDFDFTSLNKVVKKFINVDDILKRHRRVRRSVTKKDTIEHVTKIMESIEEELDDLKESQVRQSNGSEVISPKCLVLPKGGVNCTTSVYQDPNEWKQSRRAIEKQIKEMRIQLESLKEIRRHLMDKRPHFIPEDDDYAEVDDLHPHEHHYHNNSNNHHHNSHHHHHHHHHHNHHHHSKNHTRHQKKHDKLPVSTTGSSTQVYYSSTTSFSSTSYTSSTSEEITDTPAPEGLDRSYDSATQGKITTSELPRTTTVPTTIKAKKSSRRLKINKDNVDVRTDEDDKPRRRKIHHHKLNKVNNSINNNTLLTNSVNDNNLNVHLNVSSDNWPIREEKESTVDVIKNNVKDYTTTTRQSVSTTPISTRASTTASLMSTSTTTTTTTTTTTPATTTTTTTTTTTKKPLKIIKNRTGLGPARIDVTILEPPDRKHKQPGGTLNNNGRPPPLINNPLESRYKCYCEPDNQPKKDEKEIAKEERRRLKEERLRKKERKLKKKAKLEKECLTEKMNCFEHDNDHWRTAPLWNAGPFCFCMNANNNTYSCVRTINVTHNFLYCEFTTGFATFYNLRIDPFEQWNRLGSLTPAERSYLHDQLEHLKGCKGTRDCTVGNAKEAIATNAVQQQRFLTKRKYSNSFEDMFIPSALQIIREGELGSNKRRKKVSNSWNRRSRSWQSNWKHAADKVSRRHRHPS